MRPRRRRVPPAGRRRVRDRAAVRALGDPQPLRLRGRGADLRPAGDARRGAAARCCRSPPATGWRSGSPSTRSAPATGSPRSSSTSSIAPPGARSGGFVHRGRQLRDFARVWWARALVAGPATLRCAAKDGSHGRADGGRHDRLQSQTRACRAGRRRRAPGGAARLLAVVRLGRSPGSSRRCAPSCARPPMRCSSSGRTATRQVDESDVFVDEDDEEVDEEVDDEVDRRRLRDRRPRRDRRQPPRTRQARTAAGARGSQDAAAGAGAGRGRRPGRRQPVRVRRRRRLGDPATRSGAGVAAPSTQAPALRSGRDRRMLLKRATKLPEPCRATRTALGLRGARRRRSRADDRDRSPTRRTSPRRARADLVGSLRRSSTTCEATIDRLRRLVDRMLPKAERADVAGSTRRRSRASSTRSRTGSTSCSPTIAEDDDDPRGLSTRPRSALCSPALLAGPACSDRPAAEPAAGR